MTKNIMLPVSICAGSIFTGLFFAVSAHAAATLPPVTFPVFLRAGFSTVLEFEEPPQRVVLGDPQSFQIEKLDRSIVIKTNVPYATSNMFVYFKSKGPRLLILTASEEAEPTYYKKFESMVLPNANALAQKKPQKFLREAKVVSKIFDNKKDYLTVEVLLTADSRARLMPDWDKVRIKYQKMILTPKKLWSERKEIQKDSRVKARFIFYQPNIPKNYHETFLILPLKGETKSFVLSLEAR
jgi:hypothetical protein